MRLGFCGFFNFFLIFFFYFLFVSCSVMGLLWCFFCCFVFNFFFPLVNDCLENFGLKIIHWFSFTSNIKSIHASTPNFEAPKATPRFWVHVKSKELSNNELRGVKISKFSSRVAAVTQEDSTLVN